MLVVFFAVIGLTWYLFQIVPKGFIPDQDTDQISLQMLAAQGTSFYKMVDYQKAGGRHRPQGSQRRHVHGERGRGIRRPERQQRADEHPPEAAQ